MIEEAVIQLAKAEAKWGSIYCTKNKSEWV